MLHHYKTKGTCSKEITFHLDGNVVHDVKFSGGCEGNLRGVSRLVEGMTIEEIADKLANITCKDKPTSCPDQLAKALQKAKEEMMP